MQPIEIRREPPRPSRVAIVVVLLVAAGAAMLTVSRDNGESRAAPTTLPDATTTTATGNVYGALLPEATGATLVLLQSDGHLVQVDVDSGTVADLSPGQQFHGVSQLIVLRDGVVVSGQSERRLVASGGMSFVGSDDQLVGTPDGIHLVAVSYSEAAARVRTFIPGAPPVPPVTLPNKSEPIALLPGALVLQSQTGGVYRFDLDSGEVSKIAEGTFVAAEGKRVASLTCDGPSTCRIGVASIGGAPTAGVVVAPEAANLGYYGRGGSALSPTRNLLAYATRDQGRPTLIVLDLDSGNVVLPGVPYSGPATKPFVWSADGRWLFWVESGHVKAWSRDRGGDPIEFAVSVAGSADLIAAAS